MTILYIDTTSKYLYTGIVRDDKLVNERKKCLGKDMSIYVINEINEMFQEVNITPEDIGKIIICNGPGSFTGIRIGVTIAKILAWSFNIPIITISSLEAMAISSSFNSLVVPIIDARRNACYAAIYDGKTPILNGEYLTLEKLFLFLKGLNKEYTFLSNDSFSFPVIKYDPNILNIVCHFQNRESTPSHLVNPLYLKLTEAEENKMKDDN